jgi:hypothetical protein
MGVAAHLGIDEDHPDVLAEVDSAAVRSAPGLRPVAVNVVTEVLFT